MAVSLKWTGLDELRAQLRKLPADLADEASAIVIGRAERAKQDIVTSYPERTGNLSRGVTVRKSAAGPYGAGAIVRNSAKHAWLYEHGSQARHTAIGANRGSMPPGNIFIPVVIRQRKAMYSDLKELLVKHGATVSGDVR